MNLIFFQLRPELQKNGTKPERYYKASDRIARQRIVENFKKKQEKELEEQRERLKHALDGNYRFIETVVYVTVCKETIFAGSNPF